MQSGSLPRLVSKPQMFGFLLLLLLATSMLFVPRSEATRQMNAALGPQNQAIAGEKRRRPEFVPGEVLVRFNGNAAFEGSKYLPVPNEGAPQKAGEIQSSAAQEQILVQVDRFDGSDLVDGLRIARAPDTGKAIAALRARDDVLYAEPNYIVHALITPNDPCFPANNLVPCQSTSLYGLTNIAAPQAWLITHGDPNVVVGVVDEGIDIAHEDLQANIWTNPKQGGGSIPGISGDVHGYDFINNSGTIPAENHATHVAGTIGAVGNNGVGVVGVNWNVRLMSLRFIDQTTNNGSTSDAIRAYNYAKQMRDLYVSSAGTSGANIRALNASYGGGGFSQAEQDALTALGQSGILFVAAAGNDGRNTDAAPNYPSGYNLTNMISVAATTQPDGLASFSNFGTKSVLMGAPGVGILSTTPANTYSVFNGTSMATPHVTGAAALVCAANPNVSVNQLHALLAFNGDVVPALVGTTLTGRRVNVFKSIQALNENDTTPPGTVSNFRVTSQTGRTVNLAWNASGDDGAAGQASLYDLSFTDQFTGAVVPLTTVGPAASGSPQTLSVNIPYRHTSGFIKLREFDNVGNEGTPATFPVNVDRLSADPYATSLSSPAALSTGGTPLGLTFDDRYRENYPLPFSFPFFGGSFSTVTISTNGNLYFSTPRKRSNGDADDVPSSIGDLSTFKMIAGMWDDLDLSTSRRADADVYVVLLPDSSNPNRIIFRWQGVQFGDGTNGAPINFEIELNTNGTIKTRYGSGNTNLFPVVGISGSEPDVYVAGALTSELTPISLTNAQGAVFTPRALVPLPTIQFSSSSYTVGEGDGHVTIALTRTGDATSSATINYATSDLAGSQNCNVANTTRASSRCDYMTTAGTLQFAAGETSKSISIPIIDDAFVEGDENFTVSLGSSSGATSGTPATATVTIHDNDSAPPTSNPLDNSGFFVRQHYLDFLSREPDASGLAFWTNNIEVCGADQNCRAVKRIDTSAAFFISIEFQQTGYLVERIYKASYGDATFTSTFNGTHMLAVPIIRLNEFLPDTQEIGQGVVVGQGNWQQQIESNKQAFTLEFVQRFRFTTPFATSLTPAEFVDKLFLNAGVTPSANDRTAAINEFGGAGTTADVAARSRALRDVAENSTLNQQEFNRAFVLMQYFGYLRRNPNDPQDTDYTGYDFWLTKLNQFGGNYNAAEMVKSFIVSAEYRQRVGP